MSFRVKKTYLKKEAIGFSTIPAVFRGVGRHLSGAGPLGMMAPLGAGMALQQVDSPVAQIGGQLLMMKGMVGGGKPPMRSRLDARDPSRKSSQTHALRRSTAAQTKAKNIVGKDYAPTPTMGGDWGTVTRPRSPFAPAASSYPPNRRSSSFE